MVSQEKFPLTAGKRLKTGKAGDILHRFYLVGVDILQCDVILQVASGAKRPLPPVSENKNRRQKAAYREDLWIFLAY